MPPDSEVSLSPAALRGVTGIVFAAKDRAVRVDMISSGPARSLTLDTATWKALQTRARSAGIPVHAEARGLKFMELICGGVLASIFLIGGLTSVWPHFAG